MPAERDVSQRIRRCAGQPVGGGTDASHAYYRRGELSCTLQCVIVHRVGIVVVRGRERVKDQRRTFAGGDYMPYIVLVCDKCIAYG